MIFFNKEKKQQDIIDGVNVIYNNELGCVDEKVENIIEIVSAEVYDENGNKFYQNFSSIDEANYTLCELAERGVVAVIGPKGPIKDYTTGSYIPNPNENDIGVYIVSDLYKVKYKKIQKKK